MLIFWIKKFILIIFDIDQSQWSLFICSPVIAISTTADDCNLLSTRASRTNEIVELSDGNVPDNLILTFLFEYEISKMSLYDLEAKTNYLSINVTENTNLSHHFFLHISTKN